MNETIEKKLNTILYVMVIGFGILFLLIVGLYFKDATSTTKNNVTEQTEYEKATAKMTRTTGDEAVKLFDKKDTSIIYIGRSTCGVCNSLVPVLAELQDELDFKSYHIEFDTESYKTDLAKLADKLDYKTQVKTTINNEKVELNDEIGNLMMDYGFTPIIVIIKDGKMVDGFIGYKDKASMKTILEKYLNN